MFSKIFNFLKNFSKKEEVVSVVKELEKKRTYLDYDWTPVVEFETGGKLYYDKFLKKMNWPKGASGITMGIGADLGYMNKMEFDTYFSKYFTKEENEKLKSMIGLRGDLAKNALYKIKNIELSWENASEAFVDWTLPKFWNLTNTLWPKIDELCEKAQIGLVSIVFNRGSSTRGPSRTEMFNIKLLVLNKDYKGIAREIRSMKRIWKNRNMVGLIKRREEEAKMVEGCV